MDPSLRWGDDSWVGKALFRWDAVAINRPRPEIEADAHPHAQLRLVVDARGLDQKLPRGEAQRLGETGAARVFADDLAIFDTVTFNHAAGDFRRRAGRDAFDRREIGCKFAVIRFAQPRHRIQLRAAGAKAWTHHALRALPIAFTLAGPRAAACGQFR